MPLEFRGTAIIHPSLSAVRFAGYPRRGKEFPTVICEVTADALRYLGHITHPTEEALMSAFEAHKAEIEVLASSLYDAGAHRPSVTLKEVVKGAADKLGIEVMR